MKITNEQLTKMVNTIIHEMVTTYPYYKPKYVVGVVPGGLQAATMISEYFGVPMYTLHVNENDSEMNESNCWMAEDAFGYVPTELRQNEKSRWDVARRKNILIIDSINSTGSNFSWIKNDWQSGCFPNEQYAWDSVWNHTVRFAVLVNDGASQFKDINYSGIEVTDQQVEFPWQNWWK